MKATGKNKSIPMTIPHKQPEDHFKNRPKGTEPKKYVKKAIEPVSDESENKIPVPRENPLVRKSLWKFPLADPLVRNRLL